MLYGGTTGMLGHRLNKENDLIKVIESKATLVKHQKGFEILGFFSPICLITVHYFVPLI